MSFRSSLIALVLAGSGNALKATLFLLISHRRDHVIPNSETLADEWGKHCPASFRGGENRAILAATEISQIVLRIGDEHFEQLSRIMDPPTPKLAGNTLGLRTHLRCHISAKTLGGLSAQLMQIEPRFSVDCEVLAAAQARLRRA
jgi:hypothetical protein